jgi:hypothetical protein
VGEGVGASTAGAQAVQQQGQVAAPQLGVDLAAELDHLHHHHAVDGDVERYQVGARLA